MLSSASLLKCSTSFLEHLSHRRSFYSWASGDTLDPDLQTAVMSNRGKWPDQMGAGKTEAQKSKGRLGETRAPEQTSVLCDCGVWTRNRRVLPLKSSLWSALLGGLWSLTSMWTKLIRAETEEEKLKEMKTINSCYKAGPQSQVPFSEPNDKAEWLYDIEEFMNCPESMTKNWRAGILPMKGSL